MRKNRTRPPVPPVATGRWTTRRPSDSFLCKTTIRLLASTRLLPMAPMNGHRKKVKHYHEPGDLHELTFSCYERRPLLTNDRWRKMLSESIDRGCAGHDFKLVAFVFMPEHVHLLVYPTVPE